MMHWEANIEQRPRRKRKNLIDTIRRRFKGNWSVLGGSTRAVQLTENADVDVMWSNIIQHVFDTTRTNTNNATCSVRLITANFSAINDVVKIVDNDCIYTVRQKNCPILFLQ